MLHYQPVGSSSVAVAHEVQEVQEVAAYEAEDVKENGSPLTSCSGAEYNQMSCSCLASAYNLRECPDRLKCKYNFIDSYTRQIIFWHVPKIS